MLYVTRYVRACLILCLPLLAGCGGSPLPLSVAGMSGPTSASVNSPHGAVDHVEGGGSPTPSSSHVPAAVVKDSEAGAAAPVDVSVPDAPPASPFDAGQLVGCWKDTFYGQRTLTLKADGSATMFLELDFAGRLLYGRTLEFDLNWSLEGSTLSFEILSGRPVDAAKSAMKLWGEAFDYRLELVDNENLHGWASDDSSLYKLRRVDASDASDAETQ